MVKVGKSKARCNPSEITLGEFAYVREQFEKMKPGLEDETGDPVGNIMLWCDVLERLGANETDLDDITTAQLLGIAQKVSKSIYSFDAKKFTRCVVVDGEEYEAYEKGAKFKFGAKTMGVIELIQAQKGTVKFSEVVAAVFKKVGGSKQFDPETVIEKAPKFEAVSAAVAMPYVAAWFEGMGETLQIFQDAEPSEGVE